MRSSLLVLAVLVGLASSAYKATNSVNTWAGNITYNEDWGYTDVRSGAHSFWWLYARSNPKSDTPLFLWLQGGPGSSGVGYGNFEETGPKDLNGQDRASTWLQVGDLVFVDNPVGSGFSYVDSSDKYTTDVAHIGQDLLQWAIDFFAKHPEYTTRPFFIVCESYGGKMTAEFARQLYLANASGVLKTNLKGVGLGDSWISPMDFVNTWGPYLYAQSYLDDQQLATVNAEASKCQGLVNNSRWTAATDCWGDMEDLVSLLTGGVSWYNVLKHGDQDDWSSRKAPEDWKRTNRVDSFKPLTRSQKLYNNHVRPQNSDALSNYMDTVVRQKLGIIPSSVRFGAQSNYVFDKQYGDFMKPNYDTVDQLLNYNLQVTVFSGQLDLICDTMGAELWINRLKWSGLAKYKQANKAAFGTKSYTLAGSVKTYKNLQFIYILRAGHMVAHDTEESGLYVLNQLIARSKVL